MSETPKSCSDCGKCTIGSKECIGCPNFEAVTLIVSKAFTVLCNAMEAFIRELSKILPPLLEALTKAADAYLTAAEKEPILPHPHPRPDYKKKPKKYEAPIRRFIHHDRGRR